MEFLNKDLPPLPKECIEAIQKIEKWYDELDEDACGLMDLTGKEDFLTVKDAE